MIGKNLSVVLVAFTCLVAVACGTNEDPLNPNPEQDVTGVYNINFAEQLVFKLDLGQGIRAAILPSLEGWAEFGNWEGQPLLLDVAAFCADPDIQCPFELFSETVSVEQLDQEIVMGAHGIIIHDHLSGGDSHRMWSGIVDHNNYERFRIPSDQLLMASFSPCVGLEASQLEGRFDREYETLSGLTVTWETGEPISGIAEGHVRVGWPAWCAFGDLVPEDATLWVEVAFTGQRMGNYQAPSEANEDPPDASEPEDDASSGDDVSSDDASSGDDVSSADAQTFPQDAAFTLADSWTETEDVPPTVDAGPVPADD